MADEAKKERRRKRAEKFDRFWTNLFTYAYDCDNPTTLLINETFFIISGIVFTWLCSLVRFLNSIALGWVAVVLMLAADLYFVMSVFIGLTTYFQALIRKKRIEKGVIPANRRGSEKAKAAVPPKPVAAEKPAALKKKAARRQYKISNKRF